MKHPAATLMQKLKPATKFIKGKYLLFFLPPIIFFGLTLSFKNDKAFFEYFSSIIEEPVETTEEETVRHIETPEPVKAIYMTSWTASEKDLRERLVKMIDTTELNSVVIDIKDYSGRIAFEVSDPALVEIGSAQERILDIKDFINYLHGKNIYVIGRIAVFQDPYLVSKRPDLAVKKASDETVWKDYKGITWLDPCSEEVWGYIVSIALESEKVGFDELNFDYIRFPSDGNMANIKYPLCGESFSKPEEMEKFFAYLKTNLSDISTPLSADLFGMVTVNTDDLNIGQVLERAEPYFDYIAPMVYPSHYPKGYNNYKNPATMPYEIVKTAMETASWRLIAASSTPYKLRPWLQDFDLGAVYDASMVRKQKQAVYDAGLTGWMLWDASNQYTPDALD